MELLSWKINLLMMKMYLNSMTFCKKSSQQCTRKLWQVIQISLGLELYQNVLWITKSYTECLVVNENVSISFWLEYQIGKLVNLRIFRREEKLQTNFHWAFLSLWLSSLLVCSNITLSLSFSDTTDISSSLTKISKP